jgi:hypothetical protein
MVCSLRSTPNAETLEAGGGHGCDFLARAAGDVGHVDHRAASSAR